MDGTGVAGPPRGDRIASSQPGRPALTATRHPNGTSAWRRRPGFRGPDHGRPEPFPRVARGLLGGAVVTPARAAEPTAHEPLGDHHGIDDWRHRTRFRGR